MHHALARSQVRHAENQVELMKGLLEEKEIENCSVRRQLSQVGFRASGFVFRVWDLWFLGSGFGFRCSVFWASGVWFGIYGLGFGFRFSQITEDAIGIIINLLDIFATRTCALVRGDIEMRLFQPLSRQKEPLSREAFR
jgi:hypothetical protein